MIVSCEKCNKKFEVADNLIPETGRLLQCGSCSYQWHYIPINKINLVNEIDQNTLTENIEKSLVKKSTKKINKNKVSAYKENFKSNDNISENKKGISILSSLLIIIISLVALLVIVDTFKSFLITIIPGLDFYLSSLYETLIDIILFFKDLLK
jgi:predicted Zn finger-like uncharacterized protein